MTPQPPDQPGQDEQIAYDFVAPIIENHVQDNVGEDGLIVVDYATLRDALANDINRHYIAKEAVAAKLPPYPEPKQRYSGGIWLGERQLHYFTDINEARREYEVRNHERQLCIEALNLNPNPSQEDSDADSP